MKYRVKKVIAFLLTLTMLLNVLPTGVFADSTSGSQMFGLSGYTVYVHADPSFLNIDKYYVKVKGDTTVGNEAVEATAISKLQSPSLTITEFRYWGGSAIATNPVEVKNVELCTDEWGNGNIGNSGTIDGYTFRIDRYRSYAIITIGNVYPSVTVTGLPTVIPSNLLFIEAEINGGKIYGEVTGNGEVYFNTENNKLPGRPQSIRFVQKVNDVYQEVLEMQIGGKLYSISKAAYDIANNHYSFNVEIPTEHSVAITLKDKDGIEQTGVSLDGYKIVATAKDGSVYQGAVSASDSITMNGPTSFLPTISRFTFKDK